MLRQSRRASPQPVRRPAPPFWPCPAWGWAPLSGRFFKVLILHTRCLQPPPVLSRAPSRRLRQEHPRCTGLLLPHGHGGPRFWHKAPAGQGSWRRSATNRRTHPWRNTLTSRRRGARRVRGCGGHNAFSSSTVLAGSAASAAPPTLSSHNVATATRPPQHQTRGLDGFSVYGAMASPRVWCSSTLVRSRPAGHTSLLRWPPAAEWAGSATDRCRLLPARPHGARDLGPCAGQTHAAPTRPGSWDAGPPGPPTRRPGGPNAPTRVAAHQRRPPQVRAAPQQPGCRHAAIDSHEHHPALGARWAPLPSQP